MVINLLLPFGEKAAAAPIRLKRNDISQRSGTHLKEVAHCFFLASHLFFFPKELEHCVLKIQQDRAYQFGLNWERSVFQHVNRKIVLRVTCWFSMFNNLQNC